MELIFPDEIRYHQHFQARTHLAENQASLSNLEEYIRFEVNIEK